MYTHICAHNHEHIHTYFRNHEFIPVSTIPVHAHRLFVAFPYSIFACPFFLSANPYSNTFEMVWDLSAIRDSLLNVSL